MEVKLRLEKVHCAGCALALEQNLNQMDGVFAELNFVTKVLKLEISTEKPEETLEKVKDAIHKFDHMIKIFDFVEEESEEKQEKKERIKNLIKIAISLIFALVAYFVPIFWLKITLFALSYLSVAYEILIEAGINVFHGKIFDENFLMVIASIGAFVIGEYVEAVAVVLLFLVGEILEDLAVSKSKRQVKSLLEIKQPYANLVQDDGEFQVALADVALGDKICVKPGEKIPLDGVVVSGNSTLDMSVLTGETKEVFVKNGDEVLSGSINTSGVLLLKVTKLEKDSTVSKIIELVENATETKAKSEKFISRFSKIYTPTVIALAVLIGFVPPIFYGYEKAMFVSFVYRALCFLVVSCPCALVISVPLTYFAGIGALAKNGILAKGANFVEELSKVDMVVFDKTGTLTKGEFAVTKICPFGEHTEDELLEIVAYAENYSNHRIAKSVVLEYYNRTDGKKVNSAWIDGYTEVAGKGVKANIFMQETIVGNAKFLKENGIEFEEQLQPGTVLYVSVAGDYAGFVLIEDEIKPDSKKAIANMVDLRVSNVAICTGDSRPVADKVAKELEIKNVYANLLPEDKLLIVKKEIENGRHVAFVGDGINDAPTLATASVGIAMGGLGSDIAIESADVVISNDEPSKVAFAIKKSKRIKRIVLENIIGTISIKLAILGLVSLGFAGMWLAVFADVGVSVLAVLNSLRALKKK